MKSILIEAIDVINLLLRSLSRSIEIKKRVYLDRIKLRERAAGVEQIATTNLVKNISRLV